MAKTKASTLRAIKAWQKANPHRVKLAQQRYEVKNYAARKAAKAAWAQRNRAKYVNGITRAGGLKMLRERERAQKQRMP